MRSVGVLKDWRVMVDTLADDRANEARGDAATTNLVLLLAASVHRAVAAAQPGSQADGRHAQIFAWSSPAQPLLLIDLDI